MATSEKGTCSTSSTNDVHGPVHPKTCTLSSLPYEDYVKTFHDLVADKWDVLDYVADAVAKVRSKEDGGENILGVALSMKAVMVSEEKEVRPCLAILVKSKDGSDRLLKPLCESIVAAFNGRTHDYVTETSRNEEPHWLRFVEHSAVEQSLNELPLEELLQQMLLEDANISAPRRPNEQDETLSECSDWSLDESSTDDVPAGGSADKGHPDLPPSNEPQKLSEMPYRQYMDVFDEVFASGFSVQDDVAAAIIQKGGEIVRGIDLGVKFMEVPNVATERRDELRPCLKVFVSEPMNEQMKGEIAEAVVETIRVKHKKQFYSEDHEAWLDFIPVPLVGRTP